MKHLEGHAHGFKAVGIADDFVIAKARGPRPEATGAKFPVGSYVVAQGKWGRLVSVEDDQYWVQFYNYADKVRQAFPANELSASTRGRRARRPDWRPIARSNGRASGGTQRCSRKKPAGGTSVTSTTTTLGTSGLGSTASSLKNDREAS